MKFKSSECVLEIFHFDGLWQGYLPINFIDSLKKWDKSKERISCAHTEQVILGN